MNLTVELNQLQIIKKELHKKFEELLKNNGLD